MAALSNGIITAWLPQVTQFTPLQFYALGTWASPTQVPSNVLNPNGPWVNRMWFMIPRYRYIGVDQVLINQMAAWAQTMWPVSNWSTLTTATCSIGSNNVLLCSSDQ